MWKALSSRLQTKLILSFVIVVLIPVAIISAYTVITISNILTDKVSSAEVAKDEIHGQQIEEYLSRARADVLYLAQSPAVTDYVYSLSAEAAEAALGRMQRSFMAFAQNVAIYDKIRFIDTKGREIVRIDYANGRASMTTQADLQDKSQRDYFEGTIHLPAGQVYVSRLSLTQENNQIIKPYKPVIRYATPIYKTNGELAGMVITSLLAQPILAQIQADNPGEEDYLIDADGTYLAGPDSSQLFGVDLNLPANFLKDHPNDGAKILAAESGALNGSPDRPDRFQNFAHIAPPDQPAIRWTFYSSKPLSVFFGQVTDARVFTLGLTFVMLLLAVSVALLLTRSIVQPVDKLAAAMTGISQGKWDTPLPDIRTSDEIGQLTATFGLMSRELAQSYADLEKHAEDLRVANTLAKESSRLKSEFLATMSHELRTPLNAMIGFSGILLQGIGGEMDEDANHMVGRIDANAKRLLQLINDVLDIAKIEAGRLEVTCRPFSPRQLADSLQAQMAVLAEQKGLAFQVEFDPALPDEIEGDKERISQIIVNLLSNAIKFTDKGSVKLAMKSQAEQWLIEVTDTGVGIPPHALNYIFDEFRQLDGSSRRAYGGTGLGLAIVRNLCRLMDGNIRVNSDVGQGSTFTVTLPLKPVIEMEVV